MAKVIPNNPYTRFRVSKKVHTEVVTHCIPKGILYGSFYEQAVLEKIERDKLKDSFIKETNGNFIN